MNSGCSSRSERVSLKLAVLEDEQPSYWWRPAATFTLRSILGQNIPREAPDRADSCAEWGQLLIHDAVLVGSLNHQPYRSLTSITIV